VRKADNLTTILYVVMKSGNLNFLEPSGPLQACNGTALLLYDTDQFGPDTQVWESNLLSQLS